MATCPLCLFANPTSTTVCTRCGKFRFPNPVPADYENVPASEMRTRIVAELETELAAEKSALRTIRGPLTVPQSNPKSKSAIRAVMSTVKATLPSDSDAYSVVSVDATTPTPERPAPRLIVVRGESPNIEFPIYDGKNLIGRASDKPVDIDLTPQESSEQVWSSRQHAVVTLDRGTLLIEDLGSLNGTFVNRSRLHPGQRRVLQTGDVVQVGTVQFRVEI
jgi:hypothetical protein